MDETLLSVGLDVGTTSTQMIVSRLQVENRASAFAVPEFTIGEKKILYRSPVHFTPLLGENRIDGEKVREIVEREYENAGIRPHEIQTGAVIITGETSRKENAGAVLEALSELAGDFVVATAGPDLESRLAAKGAGAVDYSGSTGKTVLHMDIGGGTSNLALIENGEIVDTGCLNAGGRLLVFDDQQRIRWISPVLRNRTDIRVGEILPEEKAREIAQWLTEILEMGAGLREPDETFRSLITLEGKPLDPERLQKNMVISFSGGVADCIETVRPWKQFGDLGPLLGMAIRRSRLCAGDYLLGRETIRATVIGAGCHSAQLSGSTVFCQNVQFPLKNLPAAVVETGNLSADQIRKALSSAEGTAVLAIPGKASPDYGELGLLAETLAEGFENRPIYLCIQQDMAKALGQMLALRLGRDREILCIDRIRLDRESYLDVGAPVGPAIPVVVKTLILSGNDRRSG